MLRKIAMNILKTELPGNIKMIKNMKRFRASMDNTLLEQIIKGM